MSFSRRAVASGGSVFGAYLIDLALTFSAAYLTHRFIELPAQSYGRRRALRLSLGVA